MERKKAMSEQEKIERRNWMSKEQKIQVARKLFASMRGQYIIGQALYIAIKELDKVPGAMKEVSNIEDMKLLMYNLFPMNKDTQEITENIHSEFPTTQSPYDSNGDESA